MVVRFSYVKMVYWPVDTGCSCREGGGARFIADLAVFLCIEFALRTAKLFIRRKSFCCLLSREGWGQVEACNTKRPLEPRRRRSRTQAPAHPPQQARLWGKPKTCMEGGLAAAVLCDCIPNFPMYVQFRE